MSETCPGCGAKVREGYSNYRRFDCMALEFDADGPIKYEFRADKECLSRQIAQRDERIKWLEAVYGSPPSAVCRTHHVQNCHYCDDLGCCDNTSEAARRNAALEARALRMEKALQAVNEHLVSAVALLMVPGEPLSEWAEGRALVLKAQDALANAVLREETDHG